MKNNMAAVKGKRKTENIRTKNRLNEAVKYGIFESIANIIQGIDPERSIILHEAARGYFPVEFVYNEPFFIYRGKNSKTKDVSFNISRIDVNDIETIEEFLDFFKAHGTVETKKDIEKANVDALMIKQQMTGYQVSWEQLTVKNKKNLISFYVEEQGRKYGLNQYEVQEYFNWLIQMITDKKIGKEDVIVDNNRIVSINGEGWDPVSCGPYLENKNIRIVKNYAKVKTLSEENTGVSFSKILQDLIDKQKDKVKYFM